MYDILICMLLAFIGRVRWGLACGSAFLMRVLGVLIEFMCLAGVLISVPVLLVGAGVLVAIGGFKDCGSETAEDLL